MMDPIRAYMLVIDGEPSLEDVYADAEYALLHGRQLRDVFDSVEVVPVEIREVGDGRA